MPGVPLAAARVLVLADMTAFRGSVRKGIAEAGAGAEAKTLGAKLGRAANLAFAGAIGFAALGAAEGVKLAVGFQSQMEKIRTQAGGTQRDVKLLSDQILGMRNVQQGPQELAQAMFHLKSVGLDNANAMKALRAASDLAAVGNADLEDTTNAVAGAWRSGIKGAQSFGMAAATVNAIVGAGNVKMQDLVEAIGTGILPSARAFGVSFKSVGAALALMTDEGIPAVNAATRLRMSLSLLGAPSAVAEKQLKSIGLTGLQLANAMRSPGGIVAAIGLLKSHLDASGLSASRQAQLLSHAFGGGRSSSAILTLINNYDVLVRKQNQVNAGVSKFGSDVAAQRQTVQAQLHTIQAGFEQLAVRIGLLLLPAVRGLVGFFNALVQAFIGTSAGARILRGAVLALVGAMVALKVIAVVEKIIAGAAGAFRGLTAAVAATTAATEVSGGGAALSSYTKLVAGVGSASGGAAAASGRFAGSLTFLASPAGLAGGALVALAAGIGLYIYSTRNSLTATQRFSRSLDEQENRLGFNVAGWTRLAAGIGAYRSRVAGTVAVSGRLDVAMAATTQRNQALYAGQQRVTAGAHNLDEALLGISQRFGISRKDAIDLAAAAGVSARQLAGAGRAGVAAEQKVIRYGQANRRARPDVSGLSDDIRRFNNSALGMSDRIKGVVSALGQLLDPLVASSQATITFRNDLAAATTNLRKSGGAMGYLTQKQRDSRSAFNTVLTDLENMITDTHQSSAQLDRHRKFVEREIPVLYQLAGSNKGARAEVRALADAIGHQTHVSDQGSQTRRQLIDEIIKTGDRAHWSTGKIAGMIDKIKGIPSHRALELAMTGTGHFAIQGKTTIPLPGGGHRTFSASQLRAAGGPITKGSGPAADDVLLAASRDEWVIRAASANRYGPRAMAAVNEGRAQITVPGYAAGGPVAADLRGNKRVLSGDYAVDQYLGFERAGLNLMADVMAAVGRAAQIKANKIWGGSGQAIVDWVLGKHWLGRVPYVWGGTTPAGWDCSGFTSYAYHHFGYPAPRTSEQQQTWAQASGDQPGALVFFYGRGGTASHVGLSMGRGKMINSPHTGAYLSIAGTGGNTGFGIPPGGFSRFGGPGGVRGRGGTADQNRELARSLAAAMYGWTGAQWVALNRLWTRESNFSATARNPGSGAAGIPQDISGNFHGGARGQIIWGLRYIHGRPDERTPEGAWAHEQRFGWYHNGGPIIEPIRGVGLRTGRGYGFEAGEQVQSVADARAQQQQRWRDGPLMHVENQVVTTRTDAHLINQRMSWLELTAGL